MRIISQNGAIDIPYENADLERRGTIISAWTLDNVYGSFASYSTKEKAMKAMEMCRKQYSQCEFNKLVIPKTDENLAKVSISLTGNAVNQIAEKYVFQFPADEEI